ncbi:MAG: undecaprenyl-diphosphate phosphatase [Spirochaetales bacterium]|nr:undecaprenyl-diphosphate phosphatase [Spirochaetales bacterium]
MTILQATLLGILQGITEFLPVSSSGHLVVFRRLLGTGEIPQLFDVLLHVSTLVVICVVFRRRIGTLFMAVIRFICRKSREEDRPDLRLFLIILVATVITAALGMGISYLSVDRYPKVVSALFIVTGIILILSRYARGNRDYEELKLKDGLFTGFAQGLGVLPGISRSGIVISAALASGIGRKKAGELAFLVSLPAVLGAFLLELPDARALSVEVPSAALAAGMLSALVVGFASIKLLLLLLEKAKFHYFAFYLLPLGVAGLILL